MWLDEKFEIHTKTYKVQRLDRRELHASVIEDYNLALDKDMRENGMKFPLIGISNTKENWEEATIGLKNKVDFSPIPDILVVYGNQRLRIIDSIGQYYDIPVVVADTHDDAIILHNTLKYRE